MKTITETAPYGSLMCSGLKKIETRSWFTTHRGTLLVHQGMGLSPVGGLRGLRAICSSNYFARALMEVYGSYDPATLPLGALIGTVELVGCVRMDRYNLDMAEFQIRRSGAWHTWKLTDEERAFGLYEEGRFAWLLDQPRMFRDPVLGVRGSQGFWEYDDYHNPLPAFLDGQVTTWPH